MRKGTHATEETRAKMRAHSAKRGKPAWNKGEHNIEHNAYPTWEARIARYLQEERERIAKQIEEEIKDYNAMPLYGATDKKMAVELVGYVEALKHVINILRAEYLAK